MSAVWLVEVCSAYQAAANRVAEVAPNLAIVVIDQDPEQAVSLIKMIIQNHPNVVVLPASPNLNSSIILQAIRAGTASF